MYDDVEILFGVSFTFAEFRKKIKHGIPEEIPIFFATPVLGEKVAELGLIHNVVAVLLLIRF
jgi:hypothetical protein